ncbi:hypothetical protein SEA_THUNDERCLAP_20 [Arthrobacter phage Thunderclap]|uniref:Uncharacterized protein n=10 Tax=Amigovirus amigo TaxID=1982100 RepID=A0A0U4B5W0_9CAUD|nr:DNA binding protein [Arthrobacter phage Amigo]ALY08465.1 hypothetical protein ANANSI_20 [Arthrobacter phage Anansi]ALY09079.1 hypothetical protein GORGEOUS_20 [Arthrobacter phage Gorgeous]ALY10096.1 hypothetical protein RINGS_19 [Arthrobacter phage Rings]ALY10360.1 hypothetical protein SORJUANA_20 [Arthrobacter phage SorJuana]QFG08314.1 hypothetical protein SEA_YEEZUS_19 [Arthrobacter phage Yeezus]QFG13362.1 hypothetical protein SEA_ICHOR_19 [Arthrobacter phage Ichor]QFG13880.1 hypothetic
MSSDLVKKTENGLTTVQKMIVPELIRGASIEKIAEKYNLAPVEVLKEWRDLIANRQRMSAEERLELHLMRLENLLEIVTLRVEAQEGSDPDAIKNMLGALEQLEKLEGLNKERLSDARDELQAISEQQMHMIMRIMLAFQNNLQAYILEKISEADDLDGLRKELLGEYQAWFAGQAQKALAAAGEEEAEIVE